MNIFAPSLPVIYEDMDQAAKSAVKIKNLGKKKIFFGHGTPVEASGLSVLNL